ncbi:putative serine protease [Vibrio phage 150E35-1]|nr:putative serine protease [Vibrio phage 150E35-1]
MKKLYAILIVLCTMLSGCAANGIPDMTEPEHPDVYSKFIGVPILLSAYGSYVQLDDEWAITAAHNSILFPTSEFIPHPICDLALVRVEGEANTKMDAIYWSRDKELEHVGYPMSMPQARDTGKLLQIVDGKMSADKGVCSNIVTDAAIIAGMSGGGIYNSEGSLVGVTTDIVRWFSGVEGTIPEASRYSVGPYLYHYRDWVLEVTGNDYFVGSK